MMKLFPKNLVALLVALFACPFGWAQLPSVKLQLDSLGIYVGGQVGLNVLVAAEPGTDMHVLSLPDTLSSHVEVVEALKPDSGAIDGLRTYLYRYLITSFDTGLQYVPPIPFVQMPDGSVVSTPEFALNVVNPFAKIEVDPESGVAPIVDIFSAEDAPFVWRELLRFWPWVVFPLLLVALVCLGFWLARKYGGHQQSQAVSLAPAEPCEVTALRELERIREEKLWQSNRTKEYYSDLTDTLRQYVASRFGLLALESTSAELLAALAPLLREQKADLQAISRILEQADFAKFAKMDPGPDDNLRAIVDAIAFVDHTTVRVSSEANPNDEADSVAENPAL